MKRFAVIGLGKFGHHVARFLFEDGNEVIAIDNNKEHVQDIAPFCSEAIYLDATERERLSALGLEHMDAVVVSVGTNLSVSILICLYLQEIGVKSIIAKAIDQDHAKILTKVGATEIIHPEKDTAIRVARSLSSPNMLDFIPLGKGFTIAQIEAPPEFAGYSLSELNLRAQYNVHVIAIKEKIGEECFVVPPADFRLKSTDVLVVVGKTEDINKIREFK